MDTNMERIATDTLLERGVGFRIPAPFLFRLFGKKVMTLKVKRLYLGTLIHLSELADIAEPEQVDVGKEREEIVGELGASPVSLPLREIVENRKQVCRVIAACLLNNPVKIRLFRWWLSRVLLRRCTPDHLQELALWLYAYGRVESFTNTTKLLRTMIVTTPRTNLGQTQERS